MLQSRLPNLREKSGCMADDCGIGGDRHAGPFASSGVAVRIREHIPVIRAIG